MKTNPGNSIISLDELWAFYNSSNSFFCIIGTDGYLRHANPAMIKASGYTEEELLTTPYPELIHPDDLENSLQTINNVSKGEPVFSYRSRFHTRSFGYRWFEWTATSAGKPGIIYCTAVDCTEKKEAEEELERLSLVAKKTANGITITDKNRKILWVNDAFCKMTGYQLDEVKGKYPSEILAGPLTDTSLNEYTRAQIEKEQPFFKEVINYKKNGESFWMRVEGQPIFDDKGNLVKWVAMQTDITRQKRAEEAIMNNERKYRSIFENSPLSNFIYDPYSLQILEVNNSAVDNYGYTMGEFIRLTASDLKAGEDSEVCQQTTDLIRNGTFHGSCKHKKKDGEIIIADVTASIIEYRNNKAVLMIVKDVTEKIRLQEELAAERLNKEKNFIEATLHGQEVERVEIGKELHDNINQMLTTVKLYHEMAIFDKNNSVDLIKKGTDVLLEAINEIRALSKTLVAPDVNELDLSESVQDLIETIMRGKAIKIDFRSDNMIDGLPGKLKLTLYRIVQEQLNNILKHARANHISIAIENNGEFLRLLISDDGQGFDTSSKKHGIGLKNIISRTELYNGTTEINSSPGNGCSLIVNIPSIEILKIAV